MIWRARQRSELLGISFHVGSQMMCPMGYGQALRNVSQQVVLVATLVDIIDVGGGFPARYPGMEPPVCLRTYVEEIHAAFRPDGSRIHMPALVRARPGAGG